MNKHEQATPHAGAECNTIVKYITQGRGEAGERGSERQGVSMREGERASMREAGEAGEGVCRLGCVDEKRECVCR